jgi:hypothetical protein
MPPLERGRPMKLGEILVEKRLLTPDQLDRALKAQLIFGGHLGTSLIETGLLDEDTLGDVLSSSAGVPYAPRHLLADVRPAAIKAVPRKVAEEYQVVPIKLEAGSIHLAFVNPGDLRALDALRFVTGRSVVAWIAPEVRILQALESYYGVQRPARYIRLDLRLTEHRPSSSPRVDVSSVPSTMDIGPTSSAEPDSVFGYGRPWREIARELYDHEAARPEPPSSSMSLPRLAELLCRAESRDDLAQAVLDFAVGRAERALLMFVRAGWASVWEERGFELVHDVRTAFKIDVTRDAVFHALMGSDHYLGALPPEQAGLSFYRGLGVVAPTELLLVPIHVNDRLVAAAVADGGPMGGLQGDAGEFLKAFRLLAKAVLMVALKKNMRDIAQPVIRTIEA